MMIGKSLCDERELDFYLLLWPFRFSTFKVNWSPSLILPFLSKIITCKKKQAMRQWNVKLSNTVWLIVGTIKVDGCLWSCLPSSPHKRVTIEMIEITHHHNFRPNSITRLVGVYLHAVNRAMLNFETLCHTKCMQWTLERQCTTSC